MRFPAGGSSSLRRGLPALIFGLLGVFGAIFSWLAYDQVQQALRASGAERLIAAATQVAALLDESAERRLAEAERLSKAAAASQAPDTGASIPPLEAFVSRSPTAAVLLYDADGRLHRQVGAADGTRLAPPLGVSPLVAADGLIWYYTTVSVAEPAGGRISIRRALSSSQAASLIERLIGPGALLKFGNADGSVWTDLSTATEPPPAVRPGEAVRYTTADGRVSMGVAVAVPDTPWLVWVSDGEDAMLAPASALIRRMIPITVVLMIVGAFPVYWLSGRITRPLVSLASASEAIAAGDYSRRVADDRRDEIGRLAKAFNTMAAQVQADQQLLENRVIERTQELERARRELHRQAASLKAANAELEAFSYSVSHDLRAPLRHIAGFAALLDKHGALDDKGKRFLSTISQAAGQMGRLVDDLLSFSRMGRMDLLRGEVDLTDLVREIVADTQRDAPDRDVRWTMGELPLVKGDRSMLRVAFANLVQNAHKYTSRRDVAEIEIGADTSADDEVVIYVRDNGAGFDMAYADKLFGVFQRLHGSDEFEGTGIGLANVRRVVQRHGGRVWATGSVDGGATFYVALPANREELVRA